MSFTEYPLTTNEYPPTVNEQTQSYQANQNEKDNITPVSIPLPAITRNNANNDLTLQYTPFSNHSDYNDNGHSYVSPLSPRSPRSPIPQYTPTTPTLPYTSTPLHTPIPYHTSIQHTPTMQYAPMPQYTQYESMPQYTPTSQYTPMPQMSHNSANNDYIAPAMQPCSCCSIPMQQYDHVIQTPQCYPQISASMPIQQFIRGDVETQQLYSSLRATSPRIPPQTRMNDSFTVHVPVVFEVYYVPRPNQRRNCFERMLPHGFQNTSYEPVFPQQERVRNSCSHICPYCN